MFDMVFLHFIASPLQLNADKLIGKVKGQRSVELMNWPVKTGLENLRVGFRLTEHR